MKVKIKGQPLALQRVYFLNDSNRINFSYFSGKEEDSSIFTVSATSLSIDHSFNGSGVHRGFFLGGGFTSIEIENETAVGLAAASSKGTGLLVRGGYEYKFDSNLFLDVGFNVHLPDLDHKLRGTGSLSDLEISTKFDVSNAYLALNYAF